MSVELNFAGDVPRLPSSKLLPMPVCKDSAWLSIRESDGGCSCWKRCSFCAACPAVGPTLQDMVMEEKTKLIEPGTGSSGGRGWVGGRIGFLLQATGPLHHYSHPVPTLGSLL